MGAIGLLIDNLGVLVCVVCFLLLWFSWRNHNLNKYNLSIVLLVLAGLVIRLYMNSDLFLHEWDERYHALVAKNLINHPFTPTLYDKPILAYDYKSWVGNHIWLHKQPMTLWLMAGSIKVFGANEFAVRLPSLVMTLIGILLVYKIGAQLFSRKVGYWAAFLFTINGLILENSSGRFATDHVDISFLFFVTLGVFFAVKFAYENKKIFNVLCGIAIGAAILCKWLPALIILPIWFSLLLYRKVGIKRIIIDFFVLCFVIAIIFLPWQIYINSTFPLEASWEQAFNVLHIFEPLEGQSGPFYYHFEQMRIAYGELVYIPVCWFTWVTIKKRSFKHLALLVWIVIPFLFFSFVATKMMSYTLFSSPAIFIVSGYFIVYLKRNIKLMRFKWFIHIIIILLIALPIRYMVERVKPFNKFEPKREWAENIVHFSKLLDRPDRTIVFNTSKPIEVMFYSDCIAYSELPTSSVIDSLVNLGYDIYIDKSTSTISYKNENESVTFINLTSEEGN